MIVKGISWGQNLKVSDHAFSVIRGEGGVVEEPVPAKEEDEEAKGSSVPADDLGEPSSFVEKVPLVEDVFTDQQQEPFVGSLTSVDLARKEGFVGDDEDVSDDEDDDSLA